MCSLENNEFSYSNQAASTVHEFHEVKFMLYVEGEDDISFWNLQFGRYIPENEYEIQKVDGKENLEPYISGILDGSISNTVVACDADYTDFMDVRPTDICIVRTYGHSIENSMFCPVSIAKYIRKYTNTTEDYQTEVNSWISTFCMSAKCMLPYEIKNSIDPKHCERLPKILKDKYQFLKVSGRGCDLDEAKISTHISSFSALYKQEDIDDINGKINASMKELRYIIQGHFLADAVMEFIRKKVKSIIGKSAGLSNIALYAAFCECPPSCRSSCQDILYLRDQIQAVSEKFSCTKSS